jgi:hypothetical protein
MSAASPAKKPPGEPGGHYRRDASPINSYLSRAKHSALNEHAEFNDFKSFELVAVAIATSREKSRIHDDRE